MTTRLFGQKISRRENQRLLTGHGRYVDDISGSAIAAAFVRSPHAHADILDIDVTGALDVAGVIAVWTHEDLPGQAADRLPDAHPEPVDRRPAHRVRSGQGPREFVGEPIVMVVAENRYIAEDAANRIDVEYSFCDPVVGVEQAREGSRIVHEGMEDNVAAHIVQNVGDVDCRTGQCTPCPRARPRIRAQRMHAHGGQAVVATWKPGDGSLEVYSSTQTSTGLRAVLAAKLEIPLTKVEVITPDVGGAFGVKINHPWPEELAVACAARALETTIKWTEDRREHFISSAPMSGRRPSG